MNKRFDDIIKSKLSHLEFDYEESSWEQLESKLITRGNKTERLFNQSFIGSLTVVCFIALIIANAPNNGQQEEEQMMMDRSLKTSSIVLTTNDTLLDKTVTFNLQQEHEIELRLHQNALAMIDHNNRSIVNEISTETNRSTASSNNKSSSQQENANSVNKNEPISIDFTAIGIQCEGKKIKFQTTQSVPDESVQWLIDDVYFLEGNSAEFTFENAGKHKLKLIYRRNQNDRPNIIVKELEIFETPDFDISIESSELTDCFNKEVSLNATPSNISYQWFINEKASGKSAKVNQKLPEGWYNITVQGVNEHGCSRAETASLKHDSGVNIYIESAFTPNNNDDENDEVLPTNLDKMASFIFRVVNPFDGNIVFETNELRPWNGSIRNSSKKVQAGEIYLIEVIATDHCNLTKTYTQKIMVL